MGDIEPDTVTVRIAGAMADIPAAEWDACAGTGDPFSSHAFLEALESTGCVRPETGWAPYHVVIEDDGGRLQGCVPLYLKGHSRGEFIFDYGWADAYERAGGSYYPKLLSAVPFTPVTGPRMLVRPGLDREAMIDRLASGCIAVARQLEVSSLHINFPTEPEWSRLGALGFLQRTDQQFHWLNEGYESFDDVLASLASRKRKAIKKERRRVAESGVSLRALTGGEIEPRHWDAFYRFYLATTDKKWGPSYLTREFFHRLGETMGERVVLIVAEWQGEPVGAALNLLGDEPEGGVLYGRNWGGVGRFKFLHFEACYYQAIDYAIRHGLARVEAGAQGEHKIQRGYMPATTYSAHWIRDPALRQAVAHFLERERRAIDHEQNILESFAPFRKDGG